MTNLPVDQFWPRAGHWLEAGSTAEKTDITVVGIGAHLTSLTPTGADKTPDAIRQALFIQIGKKAKPEYLPKWQNCAVSKNC